MMTPKSVFKEGFKGVGMADHIENGYLKRPPKVQLGIIKNQRVPRVEVKAEGAAKL